MGKSSENHNADVAMALVEVQKTTCMAMQKLLIMVSSHGIIKSKILLNNFQYNLNFWTSLDYGA